MKSLFSEGEIEKIRKIRKVFLWAAVWILIAELALGVILILTQAWSVPIGKIQGTFLILATIMFVGVNNFIRVEKGDAAVQIMALVSFISNVIGGVLGILLLWEVLPFTWTEEVVKTGYSGYTYTSTAWHLTVYAMVMLVLMYTGVATFLASNVMVVRETIKPIKPLKITALVCLAYLWVFGTVVTVVQPEFNMTTRGYELAWLADAAFWVTAIAAVIISHTSGKKTKVTNGAVGAADGVIAADGMTGADGAAGAGSVAGAGLEAGAGVATRKSDAELRAEIEEKVRREMIEKEVRAELEAEQELKQEAEQTEASEESGATGGA